LNDQLLQLLWVCQYCPAHVSMTVNANHSASTTVSHDGCQSSKCCLLV